MTVEEITGRKVIEVGSLNVNGSLRTIIELFKPAEYVGVDIEKGPGVDVICNAESLIEEFGREKFDLVISTELLEHVRDWRKVISNIKNICQPRGVVLITTRSYGFEYHAYPCDFWRYEIEDMRSIFSDCEIMALEKDYKAPGVFLKVKKPEDFVENNLSEYELYNILVNKRTKEIDDSDFKNPHFIHLVLSEKLKNFAFKAGKFVFPGV